MVVAVCPARQCLTSEQETLPRPPELRPTPRTGVPALHPPTLLPSWPFPGLCSPNSASLLEQWHSVDFRNKTLPAAGGSALALCSKTTVPAQACPLPGLRWHLPSVEWAGGLPGGGPGYACLTRRDCRTLFSETAAADNSVWSCLLPMPRERVFKATANLIADVLVVQF